MGLRGFKFKWRTLPHSQECRNDVELWGMGQGIEGGGEGVKELKVVKC